MKDVSELCAQVENGGLMAALEKRMRPVVLNGTRISQQPARNGRGSREEPKPLPAIRSAKDVAEKRFLVPDQLVKGILHKGSTMVFGGGSKTNKTFGLLDLAVSVASGKPWWGFETVQGPVLYMDFELQDSFFGQRLQDIADAKGEVVDDLNLDVWNLRGHAADITNLMTGILEKIRSKEYSLIIIDPIYKALGNRDENKAGDINGLMNQIDHMAVETGAAIVIGHHFSKGNQAGKESMDRMSGSGVFGRSPDSILVITKHEQDGVFTVEPTLRNSKAVEPFCIEWKHPLMHRANELNPKKLKKAGVAMMKYPVEKILQCLGNEALTTKEWQTAAIQELGISKRSFLDKKEELETLGFVEKDQDNKWRAVGVKPKAQPKILFIEPPEELKEAA